MRKVTVYYHMVKGLAPNSTVETCVDVPMQETEADDLVNAIQTRDAEMARRLLGILCDTLALLQGYDESTIVSIRYAEVRS